MKKKQTKMNRGSEIFPSRVYVVGETSMLLHHRTAQLVETIRSSASFAAADHSDLGMILDKDGPNHRLPTGPKADEQTAQRLAAAAEAFLRNSPGAAEAARLKRQSLIAVAFRLRTGGYAVRTIGAFDGEVPPPFVAVTEAISSTFSNPVVRSMFDAVGLAPDSHYFDFLPGRTPVAPGPETKWKLFNYTEENFQIEDDGPRIRSTNYFDSRRARAGAISVSFAAGAVRLLIPPSLESQIPDMLRGTTHVEVSMLRPSEISAAETCSVWTFEDHSRRPLFLELGAAHFLGLLPDADFEAPLTIWKKGEGDIPALVATLPLRWKRVSHLRRPLTS
jgi:hypothetical protein